MWVKHLSFFRLFWIDLKEALQTLKRDVFDSLAGGLTAEAQPPQCGGESQARSDGFSISSDSKNTVYWCFGIDGGRHVLRVVNNRRYPLAIRHTGLAVVDAGHVTDFAQLSRFVSGQETIVFPRDAVVFAADGLAIGQTGTIETQLDGVGQSLYQLESGVEFALDLLTGFGAKEVTGVTKVIDTLLTGSHCAAAIGQSAGTIISSCFSPAQLLKAFGWKGLLLAPVMVAGSILEFFRSEFNAIGDQLNSRDRYRIWVKNVNFSRPTPPPTTSTQASPPPPPPQPATAPVKIGDHFSDYCAVAWPTAPVRTSTEIILTMECTHLPPGYLLAEVVYEDPNLPITPSTGRISVDGQVVDFAKSDLGFAEIVVRADRLGMPSR